MRYFLTVKFFKQKIFQLTSSFLLNLPLTIIKASFKLKKNKLVSLSHFNLDFTLQHYIGNIISKKNSLYRKNIISARIRNSRYGFEVCYLPSNPFARQKIF